MKNLIELSPEVKKALDSKAPILALESTILSHGLPYPENLSLGQELEEKARSNGVTPATIALCEGKIKIGLTQEDLQKLTSPDKHVAKINTRDIPTCLAQGGIGATTVSATMFCANLVGIKFFSTGGIGGVHRYSEETMDISADLIELSRTPITVISSGAKSILDIPKTLEYLETHQVPTFVFQSSFFPAFSSYSSNLKAPQTIESPKEFCHILKVKEQLGLQSGCLLANPIPKEHEIPFDEINPFIESLLEEAQKRKISGKDITPFLLQALKDKTQGKSLSANLELVRSNVDLGIKICKEYQSLA